MGIYIFVKIIIFYHNLKFWKNSLLCTIETLFYTCLEKWLPFYIHRIQYYNLNRFVHEYLSSSFFLFCSFIKNIKSPLKCLCDCFYKIKNTIIKSLDEKCLCGRGAYAEMFFGVKNVSSQKIINKKKKLSAHHALALMCVSNGPYARRTTLDCHIWCRTCCTWTHR